jgi:hypothetical protein
MRLLLDTHVFLWYITTDPKFPATFWGVHSGFCPQRGKGM